MGADAAAHTADVRIKGKMLTMVMIRQLARITYNSKCSLMNSQAVSVTRVRGTSSHRLFSQTMVAVPVDCATPQRCDHQSVRQR